MLLCCIGDICTILMDSSSLDINQYASLLLPPIIAKWNLLGDFDEGLLSILECLYYLIGVKMIITSYLLGYGYKLCPYGC